MLVSPGNIYFLNVFFLEFCVFAGEKHIAVEAEKYLGKPLDKTFQAGRPGRAFYSHC